MNRILRSQLPPNPRDLAVFDTTTGSSPGRTRGGSLFQRGLVLLSVLFLTLIYNQSVLAQASTYTFSASAGTFVPITGGTVIQASGVVYDDAISASQTINSFTFNGTAYTTMAINTNGWMSLGVSTTGTGYSSLSGAVTGGSAVIAPFSRDQQGQAGSEIRWEYLSASNETVVQWLGARAFGATGCNFNYQVRLNHNSNTVSFVYGTMTNGSNATSPQVGIKSAIAAGVIGTTLNSVTLKNIPAGTACNWLNAVSSRLASETMIITNAAITCPSGTTFTFTPQGGASATWVNHVATYAPATAITENQGTISWTAPTNANAYNVQYRAVGSCTWTDFPGNPVAATTATLTGLSPLTSYQVRVQSLNTTTGNTCRFSHLGLGNSTSNSDGYTATGYFTTLNVQCSGAPAAPVATLTGSASICAGATKGMTATNFGNELGLSTQWLVSTTSGGPYAPVVGGTGATTGSYTTAAMTAGTYYFVCARTCANSAITTNSNELVLTVNALPNVVLTATNGGAFCGAQTLTASGASTYAWTPANSLASATGETVLFTGTSSLTVNVSGTDANGCVGTASQAVTYTAPEAITITATVPTFCGVGGTSTLTASSAVGYTYTWSVNETGTLSATTGASTDFTVAQTSSARVIGTDATTGCTAIANYSVGVYPLPSATVTTTASGVCPGTPATINSGLSAGNFSVTSIPYVPFTVPATATTLVQNGVATPALSGGTLDDGGWGNIPIGFNFNYFGTNFNTIAAGTNGLLMFGTVPGYGTGAGQLGQYIFNTTGGVFPNLNNPGNVIALMAGDQYLSLANNTGSIKYWVEGVAPNRRFVILYNNVPRCCSATGLAFTAYAVLYETLGMVDIHILNSAQTSSNTVGLQDGTKTIGATAPGRQNFTTPITTPEAWRFAPPANYLTVWSATDVNGTTSLTNNVDGSTINTINGFSATVAPLLTTQYSISYANATTGCSNAATPAQVTMLVLGNVAPQGVSATSTVTTACPDTNIPLATSYTGSLDGLTFQWQVSTDGGASWADITGATAATYTATQTVPSSYQVGISSCGGTVTYSTPVAIALTGFLDCYCVSNATSTADEEISNVTVGTVLNNSSDCATLAPGPGSIQSGYSNYTTLTPISLIQDVAYPISVTQTTCGGSWGNIIGAWIDYNHNGLFTDAGEQILLGSYLTGNQTATGNFTVPATSLSGLTRMRVVSVESTVVNPCGTYLWGETEDYYVNILGPCDPALFTPPLASADEPDATVCGTQTSQLTAFDFNGTANPIYMWYDAAVGGTLLQNSTSNFYTPAPISATTTWYVATNTGTCITDRFPVTLNWLAPASISLTNSTPASCGTASVATDLAATSSNVDYVYTWTATPSAGSGITAGTTGASVAGVTPTVNGEYTYTATAFDSATGCTAVATTTVNFYPGPEAPTGVTGGSTCLNGTTLNVSANGAAPTQTLTVALGSNVNLPGAAVGYTLPYGTLSLSGNVSIPAGAIISSANLVVNGLTANGFTWLSDMEVSLSGVSTIANQVFQTSNTSPTNGGPYTISASIPTGSGGPATCHCLPILTLEM